MTVIKLRRGTAAQWTSANPVLAAGEPGFESDTGKHKIGDGSSDWSELPYFLNDVDLSATYAWQVQAPTDGSDALPAIQATVTAAAGRPLFLPPGNYTINGSITGAALDLHLAQGARILQTANVPAIEIAGSGSGSSRALQADAAAGQNIVQANTVGMAVGDWVLIRSNTVWPGPKGTKTGELHQVRQIDGSTQFRTLSNLDFSYTLAGGDSVVIFTMAKGVRVGGGGEFVNTIGATMEEPMVRLTACLAPSVDVNIVGAGGPGVTVSGCALFDVRARLRGSLNDEGAGNFGYGVEAFGASCHGTVHVTMAGGRHAFTTNGGSTGTGVPRHITVSGEAAGLTETAWDTHEEGYNITFRGVEAVGCRNGAAKHRAPQSRIVSPVVRNCLGIGIRFSSTATGGRLDGGDLRGVKYLSAGSPGIGVQIEADDVTVTGDPLIECDDQGISVADGADNSRLLSGTIRAGRRNNAPTSIGVELLGTSTGHRIGRDLIVEEATTRLSIAAGVTTTNHRRPSRRINLELLASHVSHVGFDTIQNNSASWWNTRRLSSGAQNDEFVVIQYVEAGTYTLDSFHDQSTARGIYTVAIAPVSAETIGTYTTLGTFDGYAAASGRLVSSITGIVIPTDGLKAIRYKMTDKNASSSSYNGSLTSGVLVRTA